MFAGEQGRAYRDQRGRRYRFGGAPAREFEGDHDHRRRNAGQDYGAIVSFIQWGEPFADRLAQIDCADGEGSKHHLTQIKLAHDIVRPLTIPSTFPAPDAYIKSQAGHLSSSETGASIMGVVLASNLVSGRQDMVRGSARPALARGKSITGSCMSWGQTVSVLEALREGVRARRGMTTRARPF